MKISSLKKTTPRRNGSDKEIFYEAQQVFLQRAILRIGKVFFSMMIKVTFLFINPSTFCKFQCHSHYLLMCSTGAIGQVCIHEGPNFSVPRSSKIDCWGLQQTQKYHASELSQSTQKEPINQQKLPQLKPTTTRGEENQSNRVISFSHLQHHKNPRKSSLLERTSPTTCESSKMS